MADDQERKSQALALGALSRTLPTPDQFREGLAEMLTGSPRAAALMGAAHLDLNLEGEIESEMVAVEVRDKDNVFAPGRGALSSTESKIHMAYCLGMFGKTFRDDMLNICKIRNAFAHSALSISFDTQSIKSKCLDLKALRESQRLNLLLSPIAEDTLTDPRRMFVFSCIHLPQMVFFYRRWRDGALHEVIRLGDSPLP